MSGYESLHFWYDPKLAATKVVIYKTIKDKLIYATLVSEKYSEDQLHIREFCFGRFDAKFVRTVNTFGNSEHELVNDFEDSNKGDFSDILDYISGKVYVYRGNPFLTF